MAIIKLQGREELKKGIHYEFDSDDEPLGIGGMGKVYAGRCVNERNMASREVAIKFMYDDLPETVIERARREASIQIHNDNLVEMLGFIETESKGVLSEIKHHYHVVSELLKGVMLDDLLQGKITDHNNQADPFAEKLHKDYKNDPYHFAFYIIRNVLSGVMALHDAGYIHRDIDPTNIMVTSDGHVKLIDFGIAKKLSSLTTYDKSLTTAGQFMGKAQFAAPELVFGDVRHQDRTTDIYAIGIIFFQFIVGHPPFEGATHEVLDMQLHKKMPLQLIERKKVREIIAKATNKKQDLRYQTVAEFRVAVEQLDLLRNKDNSGFSISMAHIKDSFSNNLKYISVAIGIILIIGGGYLTYNVLSSKKIEVPEQNKKVTQSIAPSPSLSPSPSQKANALNTQRITYESAVKLLSNVNSASEGLKQLKALEEKGDFKSTYLLGRLYYSGKDYQADNVKQMKRNCGIHTNLQKSHEMNISAVQLNGKDYKSLFELGSDYVAGQSRTGIPNRESRDLKKAYKYLSTAFEQAKIQGDSFYEKLINNQLKKIKPYI